MPLVDLKSTEIPSQQIFLITHVPCSGGHCSDSSDVCGELKVDLKPHSAEATE